MVTCTSGHRLLLLPKCFVTVFQKPINFPFICGPEKSIVSFERFERVITGAILRILQKRLHHWKDEVTGFPMI